MAVSDLVKETIYDNGEVTYSMRTFEIDVKAHHSTGLAPVITYWIGEKEITDDLRKLRFSPRLPSSYIQNYDAFQAMLYQKEQRAINQLYELHSIKPKNMSTTKQVLWSFFVMILVIAPLLVVIWWSQ